MCPVPLEAAVERAPGAVGHVLRGRRLDAVRRQDGPPRGQREAAVQRAGADVLPVGPAARRVPEPGPDPGLGPALAGAFGERRVRAADRRRHGRQRRARAARRDARRAGGRGARAARPLRERHRRARARRRLGGHARRLDRALQRAGGDRRRRGLRPRRARRPAALQRRRQARSRGARTRRCGRSSESGPVLRRARHRRHAGHQGRAEGDARRPDRRRHGPADPGPLRRRQLRRVALGARLLGGRRDARPDHRLRLPRGATPHTWNQSARRSTHGSSDADDDRRAAQVGRARVPEGVRQRRRDVDRARASSSCSRPTPRSCSRSGASPTAARRSARCSATSAPS